MKIISFELTMPNRGSWNGQWTGQDKKYYIVKTLPDRFARFMQYNPNGSYHYSWNDGWSANVRAEIIDSKEAKKRRKVSSGFCGYDWMVESILKHGKIIT